MKKTTEKQSPKAQLIVLAIVYSIFTLICFTMCGGGERDKVSNSPIDASVYQVEVFLTDIADMAGDNYEGMEWSEVVKQDNGNFIVRHKYRNCFGVKNQVFTLNADGSIVDIVDFLK